MNKMSNTRIWAITVFCIVCSWALYSMLPSLVPVFIALFLAYIIHPLINCVQKYLKLRNKIADRKSVV